MRVLVVGGGRWQVPLCESLDSWGYQIVLVDPNANSPCGRFAERIIQADIRDVNSILDQISTMSQQPSLILTDQSDYAIETASLISSHLDLPGITPSVCEIFRNKLRFRRFLESELNVKFPKYFQISNKSELDSAIDSLGFPFVLKPADSQSSRGFTVVSSADIDLGMILENVLSNTKLKYVVAEQFISGTEVTIEGICIKGRHHALTTGSKLHFRPGIASRIDYPARIQKIYLERMIEFHNDMIEATGLETALTHSEYLIDAVNGNFAPVEIACRGGGNLISSDIVPWMTGLDVYKLLVDALNGIDSKISVKTLSRCATLQFFEFGSGHVSKTPDFGKLSGFSGRLISEFHVEAGQIVGPAVDDRSRHGFAILLGAKLEELEDARQEIEQLFDEVSKPRQQNGESD